MPQLSLRRRAARVRPYLPPMVPLAEREPSPGLLSRVLDGLRALPTAPPRDGRTALVRLLDAQDAPTAEIPVVVGEVGDR